MTSRVSNSINYTQDSYGTLHDHFIITMYSDDLLIPQAACKQATAQ